MAHNTFVMVIVDVSLYSSGHTDNTIKVYAYLWFLPREFPGFRHVISSKMELNT